MTDYTRKKADLLKRSAHLNMILKLNAKFFEGPVMKHVNIDSTIIYIVK